MQLVATPDTDCYFWFWPPFVQGHIIQFLLVTCLWNVFSLSHLLNLMFIQIFTYVKFAENKHSWQWEDIYFFAELLTEKLHKKLYKKNLNRFMECRPWHLFFSYIFFDLICVNFDQPTHRKHGPAHLSLPDGQSAPIIHYEKRQEWFRIIHIALKRRLLFWR